MIHLKNTNRVVFIIGNGLSRRNIDLKILRNKGTIIGCNTLYKDFIPDVLIAGDQKMIARIGKTTYPDNNYFIAPGSNRKRIPEDKKAYILPIIRFHTTGCAGMHYAGLIEADVTYLIGFDCYGDNIYSGTEGYSKTANKTKYKQFVEFYEKAMKLYPSTKYINVIKDGKDGISPRLQDKHYNYDILDMDEFIFNVPKFPDQKPVYYHDEFRKIQEAKAISPQSE
jgi:hypothetical protein